MFFINQSRMLETRETLELLLSIKNEHDCTMRTAYERFDIEDSRVIVRNLGATFGIHDRHPMERFASRTREELTGRAQLRATSQKLFRRGSPSPQKAREDLCPQILDVSYHPQYLRITLLHFMSSIGILAIYGVSLIYQHHN